MFRTSAVILLFLLLAGCQREQPDAADNGVYYWRTDLRLDSTELTFLRQHDIRKVYCRYFDVVMRDGQPMPNATITFSDTLPAGIELVPTVYITEDCMHQPHDSLAARIVRRIHQMNQTNDIRGVREIQIDCDYTARSRQLYYDFLREISHAWKPQTSNLKPQTSTLSATIRLHQLSMPAPPADYGVLMLYNTGDPRRFRERNPVLDLRDVSPYLNRLDDYPLPLAAAYPVYRWVRHISGVQVEHVVDISEIIRVKEAVERRRPSLSQSVVTYHLDKENIERYTPEDYEKIYHH